MFLSKINSWYSISWSFRPFYEVFPGLVRQVSFLKSGILTREEHRNTVKTVICPLEECNGEVVQPGLYGTGRRVYPYCAGWWVYRVGIAGYTLLLGIQRVHPLPGYTAGSPFQVSFNRDVPSRCLLTGMSLLAVL